MFEEGTENSEQEFNSAMTYARQEVFHNIQRIGYFSAGTIALSITFLGSLLSESQVISALKSEIFFFIPVVTFLFVSWIVLLLTVILSIFVRNWYALYLRNKMEADYIFSGENEEEARRIENKFTRLGMEGTNYVMALFPSGLILLTFFAMVLMRKAIYA